MAAIQASLAFLFMLLGASVADTSDQVVQECTQPLTSLLTCLDYVQGKSPVPPKDCCEKLLPVHLNHPKCLCELIAAGSEGGISGLPPVNATLALKLPVVCNVPAVPSRCPGLLGISPSSSAAKIFESSAPSATPGGAPAQGPSAAGTGTTPGGSGLPGGSSSVKAGFSLLVAGYVVALASALF